MPKISNMTMMKVIDINSPRKARQEIFDIAAIISSELHGDGNGSYFPWEIVENPTGESHGGGYVTSEETNQLTKFCLLHGAEIGETVLIYHWW